MKNEFREEIPIETIYSLAERIHILTDAELDELWFAIGYIYSEREPGPKAISQIYIDRIRAGVCCAMSVVQNVLFETYLKDIEDNLRKIEKRSGYR